MAVQRAGPAASDRPKLYGGFARRALERHGAFAELLPIAVDAAEFGIDPGQAAEDPALLDKVRDSAGVFFVGGAPQRLARRTRHDGEIRVRGDPIQAGGHFRERRNSFNDLFDRRVDCVAPFHRSREDRVIVFGQHFRQ